MVGRQQISGDTSVAEAVKHTVVGGETIAGNGVTSWIYPGNASSVTFLGNGNCEAVMRGAGGNGLEATEYRKLAPLLGWGPYVNSSVAIGRGFGNVMVHEFAIRDTSGSTNTITWNINYNSYGDEEGRV